ncbi:MAG: tetratricopeptide repeat protein [Candidatus Omnitrophica bacterium]|nr:tetratricopeptide repeat protein [Candidatus Omnitrophota bacterium]
MKKINVSQMMGGQGGKILLIGFGILLAFVCLEIILQIGGMLVSIRSTIFNKRSAKASAAVRVLCLGESTTLNYVPFLEAALRQAVPELSPVVINGAVSGVTTEFIVNNLEKNIVRYCPDIVVTMMGINDSRSDVRAVRSAERSWKIFYFLRLLGQHVGNTVQPDPMSVKKNKAAVFETESSRYHLLRRAWREPDFGRKEALFKSILEKYPHDSEALMGLATAYSRENRYTEAEELLRNRLPPCVWTYGELLRLHLRQQRFADAEACLAAAVSFCPSYVIDAFYMQFYQARGHDEQSLSSLQRSIRKVRSFFKRETVENYRRVGEILRRRGIIWICVQYPLLPVDTVRNMAGNEHGVFFVDNEEAFRRVVLRDGYWDYFTDNFAGLFGHLTTKGNKLLSEQIAAVITKHCLEVPGEADMPYAK